MTSKHTFRYRLVAGVALALILSPFWLGAAARNAGQGATHVDAFAYADAAFQITRDRLDRPLDARQVERSWSWGPSPLSDAKQEKYAESPGGIRLTQYFDKGRMELNSPGGLVSSGLLTRELISGQLQTGASTLEPRSPSDTVLAGDPDNAWPSYASFSTVIDHGVADLTGQHATNVLLPGGVSSYPAAANDPNADLTHYVTYQGPLGATGHNVPRAFWDFMNAGGLVLDATSGSDNYTQADPLFDWLSVLGYPLSDPYWANLKVAGAQTWVLIQPFERRVLTYTPSNAAAWRVEMGNIGQHYYAWRYGSSEPPGPTPTPTPSPVTPGSDYFAMQVGDAWTYRVGGTDAYVSVAITGTTTEFVPGVELLVREETHADGSLERTYWDRHETVLWLAGYAVIDEHGVTVERVVYTPEVRYLGMTLELGAGWGTQTFPLGAPDPLLVLYALTVDQVARISVPAGQFDAARLTATTTLTDGQVLIGDPQVLRSFYFVPNIGIVRDIRPNAEVLDLVSAELR